MKISIKISSIHHAAPGSDFSDGHSGSLYRFACPANSFPDRIVTPLLLTTFTYLASINLITGFLFWYDKHRAVVGGRRVPEARLLTLAAIGGSPAAQIQRKRLRHKTRKEPFSTRMQHIVEMQRVALAALAIVIAILLW